jgi:hypothetical protein
MTMTDTKTIPENKAELLAYDKQQWQAFVDCTEALADAQWTGLTDANGWSVKDHVMCVVSWTRAEIALLQYGTPLRESQGMSQELWDTWNFDLWNEHVRQQWINDSLATVRAERDRVFAKLIEVLSGLSDEDFARPAADFGYTWEEGKSLLSVLTAYHGDHFEEHRGYIEAIVAQG